MSDELPSTTAPYCHQISTISQETDIQFVHTVSVYQLDQFHAGQGQSYLAMSVAAKNTVPALCQFTSWTSFMLASDRATWLCLWQLRIHIAVHIEMKYIPSVKC